MRKRFQVSLRELCFVTIIVALAIALYVATATESSPMYLHVYGSMVDSTHDDARPPGSPLSPDGVPWTRIATVEIYDNRPFGFFTPNNRLPSIAIDGRLNRRFNDKFHGTIHFRLDDSNLTYDFTELVSLTPNEVVTIDTYYDIYLLSAQEDPYSALSDAVEGDSDSSRESGEQSDGPKSRVGRH